MVDLDSEQSLHAPCRPIHGQAIDDRRGPETEVQSGILRAEKAAAAMGNSNLLPAPAVYNDAGTDAIAIAALSLDGHAKPVARGGIVAVQGGIVIEVGDDHRCRNLPPRHRD